MNADRDDDELDIAARLGSDVIGDERRAPKKTASFAPLVVAGLCAVAVLGVVLWERGEDAAPMQASTTEEFQTAGRINTTIQPRPAVAEPAPERVDTAAPEPRVEVRVAPSPVSVVSTPEYRALQRENERLAERVADLERDLDAAKPATELLAGLQASNGKLTRDLAACEASFDNRLKRELDVQRVQYEARIAELNAGRGVSPSPGLSEFERFELERRREREAEEARRLAEAHALFEKQVRSAVISFDGDRACQ